MQSELLWGTDLTTHPCGPAQLNPGLIVGSDITYDEAQFQPLLQTITAFLAHDESVKVQDTACSVLESTTVDVVEWHSCNKCHVISLTMF